MATKIKLVAGDTAPDLDVTLSDYSTGTPLDLSDSGDVIKFYYRVEGSSSTPTTIVCTKPNGGSDGRVRVSWGTLVVGEFEGEFEITFQNGKVQTVYDKLYFTVRDDIGP
jgi:hypothetical protein